jgi:LPXTG-motif cell wall-anchored protein
MIATLGTVAFALPASAQTTAEDVIVFPVDSVVRGEPGEVLLLVSRPVPPAFQGTDCVANVSAENQESVHPGNDLILASGSTSGVVENFETEAFSLRGAAVPLTLGTSVEVSIRMGPDGISSGGLFISVDCPVVVPPTTTEAPPTTEAPTTTTVEVSPPGETPTTSVVAAFPPGQTPANPTTTQQLPATGPDGTTWTSILAILLVASGGGLVFAARRSR